MKILIVEDDEIYMGIIKKRLDQNFGAETCRVVDTMIAYEETMKTRGYDPDLILMDIMLPKENEGNIIRDGGIQLIEEGLHKDTPVILLSMWSPEEYEKKLWELNCKAYFSKPIDFDKLIQKIQEIVDDDDNLSRIQELMGYQKAYAVAQIKDLPDSKQLIVGTSLLLQAGVQKDKPLKLDLKTTPITIPIETKINIDIAVRAEGMAIAPHWIQRFEYQPTIGDKLIDFELTPKSVGKKEISVEYYYNRHWLTKIQFEVEIVCETHELAV